MLGDSIGVVPVGDTYAGAYVSDLEKDTGATVSLHDLAVPGWASEQLLQAIKTDVQFRNSLGHAEVVTWEIGGNDVRSATINQFELARKGAVALFDGFEEIARAIIESGAIKPAYGADADWKARRDLERMRSAKGDLFVAAFVLPMLVILDAAGEQGFRDAVRSWGLLLRLSSDFFLGGEQQMKETAGRIDEVVAEIEASIE